MDGVRAGSVGGGETGCLCWQGIVGGTYDRYLEGESAVSKPESQLYLPPDVSFQHSLM